MVWLLAFSLQDQVEKYGAYVGLAAFLGLAVLSLLYFAQAREVKRLRDWAGRAPERAQELEARVVAQAEEARRAPAPAAVEQPAAVTPAPASGNGRRQGTPAPIPMGPRPATAAAAAAKAGATALPGAQESAPAPAEGEAEPIEDRAPAAPGEDQPTTGPGEDEEGAAPDDAGSGDEDRVAAPDEDQAEAAAPDEDQAETAASEEDRAATPDEDGAEAAAPEEPVRAGNGVPADPPRAGEIPPVAIPRATPRTPAPRRVPAAPLRSAGPRSATLTARQGATQVGRGGAARLAAFTVLGVIVLGGGVFALAQILDGDEPAPTPNRATEPIGGPTSDGGDGAGRRAAAARPETVVVVLNGTPVEGLASDRRDDLIERGYSEEEGMIRTANATDQQRQDSLVLFSSGEQRQARDVAAILDIDDVDRIDPDTQALADLTPPSGSAPAAVTVILGADQAP